MHNRAKALDIALPAKMTSVRLPMKVSADNESVVYEDWPFILPHDMVSRSSIGILHPFDTN